MGDFIDAMRLIALEKDEARRDTGQQKNIQHDCKTTMHPAMLVLPDLKALGRCQRHLAW